MVNAVEQMRLCYVVIDLQRQWKEQVGKLEAMLCTEGIVCLELCQVKDQKETKALWRHAILLTDNRETAEKYKDETICIGCDRNADTFFDGAVLVIDDLSTLTCIFLEEVYLHEKGLPVTIAVTERLLIREITEQDFEDLYRISIQEGMEYAFLQDQDGENIFEEERLQAYIDQVYRFYGYGLWSVLKTDGTLIGCCGLSDFEGDTYGLELQYMLANVYQGRGYAQEMCQAALAYAFTHLEYDEVWIRTDKRNIRSGRLAERLGFEKTGKEWQGMIGYVKRRKSD